VSTNPFVGTWRLVSAEMKTASGEVSPLFGKGTSGCLMYGEDGYMSATLMESGRASFANPDLRTGSKDDKVAAFDTYIAYCGTYEVMGDRVVHHTEMSLFPNSCGTDQVRFYEFAGDQLTLRTPPILWDGVNRTAELVWRRAAPRAWL